MGAKSKIQWTQATWNPIRATIGEGDDIKVGWHCTHVSEGCRNCYAESMNRRLGTRQDYKPQAISAGVSVFLDEEMLLAPLRWKRGRFIFPCSMTDLFADFVTDKMLDKIFAVMALTPHHTYQVTTKRPARMREYFKRRSSGYILALTPELHLANGNRTVILKETQWPLNIWLGVSIEDQATADERLSILSDTPATMRWASAEPLLSGVDITAYLQHLDWVVCGGESGHGARDFDIQWAESLHSQCQAWGKPFFLKQLGAKPIRTSTTRGIPPIPLKLKDRKGGDMAEWPERLRCRQMPAVTI